MLDKARAAPSTVIAEPGQALAAWIAGFRSADLPDEVLRLTQAFVLDTLGVLAAGTTAPGIAELADALRQMEPDGGLSKLLIGGRTATPLTAAFVNASAAHALDFDDTHDVARVHAFSVVLPVAMAAAETRGGVGGGDFLAAIAIGAEVFCRFGLACPHHLAKGWHPTTGFGCFAAAATAARILGLDRGQTLHALALAYVQMSGNTQSIADGALSKRLGPGFAARNGLAAAQIARAGLTGPRRFLEGEAGLFALYADGGGRPDLLIEGLGAHWHLRDLSMKPYPCCRCTHTLIQIGLELHKEGLSASQVESGTLYLGGTNHRIVGAPFDRAHANPVVHAQFNACYAFAQALEDGAVDISTFTRDHVRAHSPLATRLSCEISKEIEAEALAPAHLRLVLKDGRERVVNRPTMKGSPDDPMSDEEMTEKFAANLEWGWGLDRQEAEALAAQVFALGKVRDVRVLIGALSEASRRASASTRAREDVSL